MRKPSPSDARGLIRGLTPAVAALLALWVVPAPAQLVLPGAVAPTPQGASQPLGQRPARRRPTSPADAASDDSAPPIKLPPAVVPSPAALDGKTLQLNGALSQVSFADADRQLSVTRLLLTGETISNARTECHVQAEATPIAVTSLGRPTGVERIQLAFPACPIVFDVLEGAVLVDPAQGACDFKAADCHVEPAGLWGPAVADLGPDRVKDIEKARGRAEAAVRDNYKALTKSTKDKPTVMGFARDQAQFSSTREEICRNYAGEGRHGYCAAKLTEARAAQLRQELDVALIAKAERKAKRDKARAAHARR